MTQEHMKQNKLLNSKDYINNSVDSYSSSKKYCSKCLSLLGDDSEVVRDNENNEFCSWECKVEYHRENRKLLEEIMGKF